MTNTGGSPQFPPHSHGYSLSVIDTAQVSQKSSSIEKKICGRQTLNGQRIAQKIEFIFSADKSKWPYKHDWDE